MVKTVPRRHLCRNKYKWNCNNPRVRSKMNRSGAQSTLRAPISVLQALKWLIQCLPILPYLDRHRVSPEKSLDAMLPNPLVVVDNYQHILHGRKRPWANEPDNTASDWPGAFPYKASDAMLVNK